MDIFLPIAHMDVNIWLIVAFGGLVGFLSGLVGVGGGFLITPLLIFIGVPPLVAVGTGAAQIVGTSAAGSYAHWRLGNVDARMAIVLLLGSWSGGALGVQVAKWLQQMGHFDTLVTFLYVGLLGFVGLSMLIEAVNAMRPRKEPVQPKAKGSGRLAELMNRLPWQVEFPVSKLHLSVWVPLILGFLVGILTSLMGVGGGFIMVPIMIYLLKMPTQVVVGTSLFQLLFTTTEVSILQAGMNHAVDPFLASILVLGSILGAHWGTRLGMRLQGEHLRLILAGVVMAVAIKMLFGLLLTPHDPFTLALTRG